MEDKPDLNIPDLEPKPDTLPDIEVPDLPDVSDLLDDGIDVGNINFSRKGACYEIDGKDVACLKPWVREKGQYIGGKFVIRF